MSKAHCFLTNSKHSFQNQNSFPEWEKEPFEEGILNTLYHHSTLETCNFSGCSHPSPPGRGVSVYTVVWEVPGYTKPLGADRSQNHIRTLRCCWYKWQPLLNTHLYQVGTALQDVHALAHTTLSATLQGRAYSSCYFPEASVKECAHTTDYTDI